MKSDALLAISLGISISILLPLLFQCLPTFNSNSVFLFCVAVLFNALPTARHCSTVLRLFMILCAYFYFLFLSFSILSYFPFPSSIFLFLSPSVLVKWLPQLGPASYLETDGRLLELVSHTSSPFLIFSCSFFFI